MLFIVEIKKIIYYLINQLNLKNSIIIYKPPHPIDD